MLQCLDGTRKTLNVFFSWSRSPPDATKQLPSAVAMPRLPLYKQTPPMWHACAEEAGGNMLGVSVARMKRRMCEDCDKKQSSFGLPSEGKARWCGGCAKGHAGR
jgi:hypothetical protein